MWAVQIVDTRGGDPVMDKKDFISHNKGGRERAKNPAGVSIGVDRRNEEPLRGSDSGSKSDDRSAKREPPPVSERKRTTRTRTKLETADGVQHSTPDSESTKGMKRAGSDVITRVKERYRADSERYRRQNKETQDDLRGGCKRKWVKARGDY